MNRNQFSVYQYFRSGHCETVCRLESIERAGKIVDLLMRSVGARAGFVNRIIITDGADEVAWEWKHGEGIICPPIEE